MAGLKGSKEPGGQKGEKQETKERAFGVAKSFTPGNGTKKEDVQSSGHGGWQTVVRAMGLVGSEIKIKRDRGASR